MDIACAFKQMEVEEKSQQLLKIKLQFQRLPFGVATLPFLATLALYKLLRKESKWMWSKEQELAVKSA